MKADSYILHSGDDFYAKNNFVTFNINGTCFRINWFG